MRFPAEPAGSSAARAPSLTPPATHPPRAAPGARRAQVRGGGRQRTGPCGLGAGWRAGGTTRTPAEGGRHWGGGRWWLSGGRDSGGNFWRRRAALTDRREWREGAADGEGMAGAGRWQGGTEVWWLSGMAGARGSSRQRVCPRLPGGEPSLRRCRCRAARQMKYILVTGGVISGIGKGIIASSIGTILKSCGLHVTSIKIDPYINIDAGTFSPYEHGEWPRGARDELSAGSWPWAGHRGLPGGSWGWLCLEGTISFAWWMRLRRVLCVGPADWACQQLWTDWPGWSCHQQTAGMSSLVFYCCFLVKGFSPLCYIRLLVLLATPKLAAAIKEGVPLHWIHPAVTGNTNKLLMWTISPWHVCLCLFLCATGEVFVLDDGGEVDLDLGNYERFLDIRLTKDNNLTTGKIYQYVINKERKGDYLGKTVQGDMKLHFWCLVICSVFLSWLDASAFVRCCPCDFFIFFLIYFFFSFFLRGEVEDAPVQV